MKDRPLPGGDVLGGAWNADAWNGGAGGGPAGSTGSAGTGRSRVVVSDGTWADGPVRRAKD
ncbi:hypothetical protein ACIOKD_10740 [Streptomyces sp. NPDC087844]|uniref:hypothetical protein n=1 Tax=Streptomyces sp. NPDC087844 TaxID=3365805 RepID=UPI003810ABF5